MDAPCLPFARFPSEALHSNNADHRTQDSTGPAPEDPLGGGLWRRAPRTPMSPRACRGWSGRPHRREGARQRADPLLVSARPVPGPRPLKPALSDRSAARDASRSDRREAPRAAPASVPPTRTPETGA